MKKGPTAQQKKAMRESAERLIRQHRKAFVKELAKFLVGDQASKSISLEARGQLTGEWARAWADLRQRTPLSGYPTVEEAERTLSDFLFGERL